MSLTSDLEGPIEFPYLLILNPFSFILLVLDCGLPLRMSLSSVDGLLESNGDNNDYRVHSVSGINL